MGSGVAVGSGIAVGAGMAVGAGVAAGAQAATTKANTVNNKKVKRFIFLTPISKFVLYLHIFCTIYKFILHVLHSLSRVQTISHETLMLDLFSPLPTGI
jgi:hypothetical protein